MDENIPIVITPTHVEATLATGVKAISYEDFMAAISSLTNVQAETGNQTLLPLNVIYVDRGFNELKVMQYYPEQKHTVKFEEEEIHHVVFPNILISTTFAKQPNGRFQNNLLRYFCTPKSLGELPLDYITEPRPGDGIKALALPNMYNDGRICLGSNSNLPPIDPQNLRGLKWYYELLYIAPFNNDLTIPAVGRSCRAWLQKLSHLDHFPYSEIGL